MLNESEQLSLQRLIDAYGVGEMLEALGRICRDKAENLRTNSRGDLREGRMSVAWDVTAERIDKVARRTRI